MRFYVFATTTDGLVIDVPAGEGAPRVRRTDDVFEGNGLSSPLNKKGHDALRRCARANNLRLHKSGAVCSSYERTK